MYGHKALKILFEDGVKQNNDGAAERLPYCVNWHQIYANEWDITTEAA